MDYKGKLYGKVGNSYFPLEATSDDYDNLRDMLDKSRVVIGKMKRSMMAHPDHIEGSEFDDFTSAAQDVEDEISELIKQFSRANL